MPVWIVNNIKILYYNRIDVFKEIDVNKISASKECDICHYWYFLNFSFKFQPNVCNRSHDLLMMSINLSDIAILNIKGSYYCCIISLISKNGAINLMQNADLTKKTKHYKTKSLFSYIKMGKEILKFSKIEIEKIKFYHLKTFSFLGDIEKVLVSKKISFGEKIYKYFIGYFHDNHKFKPLHIMLPKTSTYVKRYDGQTKWMYFLIEDDDLYNCLG